MNDFCYTIHWVGSVLVLKCLIADIYTTLANEALKLEGTNAFKISRWWAIDTATTAMSLCDYKGRRKSILGMTESR